VAIEYAGSRAEGARSRRTEATDVAAVLRRIDWLLLLGVAALVAYGLWAIAGITRTEVRHDPTYYLTRQGGYVAVGVIGLVTALLVDPEVVRRRWRGIYGGTVALMLIVFAAGPITRGSRRWLDLGFFKFQPSEFGKLLFVLAIGGFLAERSRRINEPRTTLTAVGLAAFPIALVFLQPDLGTALVYAAALFAVLFVCGARWLQLGVLAAAAVVAAVAVLWVLPVAGVHVLRPYQVHRLTNFFSPSQDPRGATYNLRQSMTAIGAGGWHGRGVHGSTQTNLGLLPEAPTDFAFAALSEQRGFLGATVLLLLYLLVVWRGLRVVTLAPNLYGAIVAGGIVFALLFQIYVNVGMTMSIAPITGIPLPFVSVGGSSMIANLIAVGVLLSIAARGRAAAERRR
jgi:rod shape determining protein RodA